MLQQKWGFWLAIGGWFAFLSFALWDSQQQSKPEMFCEATAAGRVCRPQQYVTERSGIPNSLERVISNPEPRADDERERRDLAAQEASAVWAFWMVAVSALGSMVTLIGTILLYKQIRLTKAALDATFDATTYVRDGNDIARQTMQVQTRAYLSIKEAVCTIGKNSVRIMIHIENNGGSHSNSTKIKIFPQSVTIYDVDHSSMPEHSWAEGPAMEAAIGVCPPGSVSKIDDLIWPILAFDGLHEALAMTAVPEARTRVRLFFEGYIEWADIFEQNQDIWLNLSATEFELSTLGYVGICQVRHRVHDVESALAHMNGNG